MYAEIIELLQVVVASGTISGLKGSFSIKMNKGEAGLASMERLYGEVVGKLNLAGVATG